MPCGSSVYASSFIGTVLHHDVGLVAPSHFARRRFLALAPVLVKLGLKKKPARKTTRTRKPAPARTKTARKPAARKPEPALADGDWQEF